ncbi:hypothetical protein BDY19DRAFT_897499 [Irpex rosettiformis]|uniref:Uncharacterized protein n=1 Tax=Irpex rosettiformis TaxID=378272 RepID=A0ACB8TSR6_9APHY|nr:hypothetical protein BDY19DRAFT_897499 [Irpex rosettiformis]
MFEEDCLSDSPRASSPWDLFLPSPPSKSSALESRKKPHHGIPKLVPEVEEGNVEYKLKLTDITPARFARLVTQLKWRLLEGGGQAYYELGVADSGALIGLPRADLEQSLETLEMMAGEIGASVIVVKEIEVPPAIVALADKVSAYIDPVTGAWAEKMVNRRRRAPQRDFDSDITAVSNGADTDVDATDYTDTDEALSLVATPDFPPQFGTSTDQLVVDSHRLVRSNPNRPTAQSSPFIFPIDDDLAFFSMEPETSLDDVDKELVEEKFVVDIYPEVPGLSLDIEITSVYKPRPIRRPSDVKASQGEVGCPARRMQKNKDKKHQQPWHGQPTLTALGDPTPGEPLPIPNKQDAKAALRRMARDRRRDERRRALPVSASVVGACRPSNGDGMTIMAGLESLHVGMQPASAVSISETDGPAAECHVATAPPFANEANNNRVLGEAAVAEVRGPRLIVEALVVRKMSLEEEFLDFGNLGAMSLS